MSVTQKMIDKAFANSKNERNNLEIDYWMKTGHLKYAGENFHNLKCAKVSAYILQNYSIELDEGDLLYGRLSNQFELTDEMKKDYQKALAVWEGAGAIKGSEVGETSHRAIDMEKLLHLGIRGILSEIQNEKNKLSCYDGRDVSKRVFYESCEIALEAVCNFAKRVEKTLLDKASHEENCQQKKIYQKIAQNFSRVPYEPCSNFYEAVQSAWFVVFCMKLTGDTVLMGHIDDYFSPFYEQDRKNGILSKEFAFELIEHLYLKHNEVFGAWPASVMLGGLNRDEQPVCNELTYMALDAIETTKLVNPSVAVCYTEDLPEQLLEKCVDLVSKGYTRPSLFNDRLIRKGLEAAGVIHEDALRYLHSTCVEITPVAASNIFVATPYINLNRIMEYLFCNKPCRIGKMDDVRVSGGGDGNEIFFAREIPFDLKKIKNFDEFMSLVIQLMESHLDSAMQRVLEISEYRKRYYASPLVSPFLNDCIKKGLDSSAGGARYNFIYPAFPGMINFIDSVAAVKTACFEEKTVSLAELAEACQLDFKGNERLRQYLLNRCPKFGNDLDEVDDLAKELYEFVYICLQKYRTVLDGLVYPSYFAWVMHGILGNITQATPDGRHAKTALSEHLGPVHGMDKNGLGAVVRSISKLDQSKGIGGIATNVRFTKDFVSDEKGRQALCAFIRHFMESDCFEVQFNVVDGKELLKAKEHPEEYQTLMVRVAGYSDYFNNLPENIQNEIIERYEYGEI